MRYLNHDIPDLPLRAFIRDPSGRIRPQGGGKSSPAAPDYAGAAQATAAGNLEAARFATEANRANQYTPWGSSTWTKTGTGDGGWTQSINLSPSEQALFNQQNQLQQGLFGTQNQALAGVKQSMGQGFDMSGVPAAGSVYDPNLATNNATELLMQRLNPQLDRQQEALRTQLANQGLSPGSAAYNTAMGQMGQTRNDAALQAALQGINLGMQQQNLQFGQADQSRQRSIAEQAYLRNLPLNELNALRTGNQVGLPQFPGYAQQATTGGPDMLGAAQGQYQANLGISNAANAGQSGLLGGIMGVGGGILGGMYGGPMGAAVGSQMGAGLGSGFSDRRLKTDIRLIGKADNGLNIYSFKYIWGGGEQLGYMADEVEALYPEAVGSRLGFKTVDYGSL